jgi:Tol biopolymer transport system component
MKTFAFSVFLAVLLCSCGENPAGPEQWPDGAYLYISSVYADSALSWSPGGSVLLFCSYAYSSYCVMGFDGIADPVVVAGSTWDESSGPNGCWSGQQGLIVYTTYNTDSTSTVRTVPGNLGALLVVIDDGRNHLHPTWTPDEDSLLMSTFENGHWGLWKTEYNEDSLLTPSEFYAPQFDCLRPSYSPDGEWILFENSNGSTSDIWLIRPDGSDPHAVIEDSHDNIHPCWGTEDDRFAFSSNRSGNYDIWISNLDGSSVVQVTEDPGDDVYPAWNPEYGWFVFSSDRDGGNYDIFSIEAPSY